MYSGDRLNTCSPVREGPQGPRQQRCDCVGELGIYDAVAIRCERESQEERESDKESG